MVPVGETARTEHQFESSHQFLKTWFLLGCDGVEGSSDPRRFIFEINVGKIRPIAA